MKFFIVDIKLSNDIKWGDETVLVLASELLHVDIQIIPAFVEVTIIKSSSESSQKQLFSLFYFSEVDFKQMGLSVSEKETPGDGSCLFHALLDQIQSHPSLPPYADSHYEL